MSRVVLSFLISIISLCLPFCSVAQAQNSASQNISAYLNRYIYIESFLIDGQEIPCGQKARLVVKSKTSINPNLNILELSPIKVKIKSNDENINVTADFVVLESPDYIFEIKNLSIEPQEQDLEHACPETTTDDFLPKVNINIDAKSGEYQGQIVFIVSPS